MPEGRIPCCVPFCRHTRRNDNKGDWICGAHWRNVPRAVRTAVRNARNSYRRRFGNNSYWEYPPGSQDRKAAVDAYQVWVAAWDACKAAAIESAAGIT